VIRAATDTATVRWETKVVPEDVSVAFMPEDGGAEQTAEGTSTPGMVSVSHGVGILPEPDVAGTYYLNEVVLTGLDPATCYAYTIGGFPEQGGRFCTMHLPDDHTTPIRVYALGDTNPTLMNTERVLAAADPAESEFVIHLGDIQYYESIVESWQGWFTLMAPLLEAGSFFPCIGNHEDENDTELQEYYVRLFGQAAADGTEVRYHFESGGVHFFSLSVVHGLNAGTEQVAWLDQRLGEVEAEPHYRFSIVFFHRPMYTLGKAKPELGIREAIEPILTSHSVPLVMMGHQHGYERFEVGDVTHITSGGGGAVLYDMDQRVAEYPEDAPLRVASGAFYHATLLTIEGRVLSGQIIDADGVVRDTFEKTVE